MMKEEDLHLGISLSPEAPEILNLESVDLGSRLLEMTGVPWRLAGSVPAHSSTYNIAYQVSSNLFVGGGSCLHFV